MIRTPLCLAIALAFTLAPAVADAQKKKQATTAKKLYRWVDKNGNVHFDDALPPEAVDQARTEFSSKTGSTTGKVDRALTPEELAAQAAQQQTEAAAAAAAADQERREKAMLESYQSEDDLRRAYGERIALLKQTLESTDVGLKSIRGSLASLLAEASTTELENRKVDAKRASQIRDLHNELVKQQGFQVARQTELLQLDGEFQRMLARYRELRAPAAPAAAASAMPAPAGG